MTYPVAVVISQLNIGKLRQESFAKGRYERNVMVELCILFINKFLCRIKKKHIANCRLTSDNVCFRSLKSRHDSQRHSRLGDDVSGRVGDASQGVVF